MPISVEGDEAEVLARVRAGDRDAYGTVRSRLHRALDRLAGVLAEPAPSTDEFTSEVRRGA